MKQLSNNFRIKILNKPSILLAFLWVLIVIFVSLAGLGVPQRGSENVDVKVGDEISKNILGKILPAENPGAVFIAVGDVSYSREIGRRISAQDSNDYPFENGRDIFKTADIVFANLETPITEGREIRDNEVVFRSDPGTESALKNAGITIVSLANNHLPDFGTKGVEDTLKYLDDASILHSGAGTETDAYDPVYFDSGGIRFALLAYTDQNLVPSSYAAGEDHPGTAMMGISKMSESVLEAKSKADIVIVSMHSGTEYVYKSTKFQQSFAHAAVDSGADFVIGHHPHVVQEMEKYKGKYIFYSLGNFIFDQMWSMATREGLMIKAYFTKSGVEKVLLYPVLIENYSQPRLLERKESQKVIERLQIPLKDESVVYWEDEI